jgi:hypothetical protein
MPKREPVGTLPNVSAHDAFDWWETNMVGKTIETPIGLTFTAKPGHFFRFVAHKLDGERKGYIDGYETAAAAQEALRGGNVDAEEISGWEQFRAEHLPQAPDLLAKPDLVLAELKDGKVSLHFVKRYGGNMLFVGYGIQGSQLAPLSFGPRTIKPQDLAGMHLLYTGKEVMVGMQNSLPALPPVTVGSWQAQDPTGWTKEYPLVDLDVNLSHSLTPIRASELAENRLAVVLNQDSERARAFAGRAQKRLDQLKSRYAGIPAAKTKKQLDDEQRASTPESWPILHPETTLAGLAGHELHGLLSWLLG